MPQAIHTPPPSTVTHLDPQQPNSTQPDPDPDSDSKIALTLQAGGKLEVLCAKFLWQEGRQVWKLHEVAPSRLFYRLFFCCCCRVLVMHSRKYVFDYYDSSRLCNFMNMNGLYVCSRFSRYFAGSLGEDKTNCNAVRWLPDDDYDYAGGKGGWGRMMCRSLLMTLGIYLAQRRIYRETFSLCLSLNSNLNLILLLSTLSTRCE